MGIPKCLHVCNIYAHTQQRAHLKTPGLLSEDEKSLAVQNWELLPERLQTSGGGSDGRMNEKDGRGEGRETSWTQ